MVLDLVLLKQVSFKRLLRRAFLEELEVLISRNNTNVLLEDYFLARYLRITT